MITKELTQFIEGEIALGQREEELYSILMSQGGWEKSDIDEALKEIKKKSQPISIAEFRAQETRREASPSHIAEPPKTLNQISPVTPLVVSQEKAGPTLQPAEEKIVHPSPPSVIAPPPPSVDPSIGIPLGHVPSQLPFGKPKEGVSFPPMIPSVLRPSLPPSELPGISLRKGSSQTKKVFILGALGILLAGLLGLGGYILIKKLRPAEDKTFTTMGASISGIQSMRYSGESRLNFSGEVTNALLSGYELGYKGTSNVVLRYEGRVDFGKGFDGTHSVGVTAQLKSGETVVDVNSTIELRIIGDTYYIHVVNPPELKDIDLSRLKNYWIAVTPSDIHERFGVTPKGSSESYGLFGGTTSEKSIRSMFASESPLLPLERIGEEEVAGTKTLHYTFQSEPKNLLRMLSRILEQATGKYPTFTPEEEANVLTLLQAIKGDVWIDEITFLPRKISFSEPLTGTISGILIDGNLSTEQSYSEYGGQVKVDAPRPVITYEEFADDIVRQLARLRATKDDRRIFDIEDLIASLEVYRANNDDRYPLSLIDLVTTGLLRALPVDPEGEEYLYAPYTEARKVDKKHRCTEGSATCAFYHLGVSLHDSRQDVLLRDADLLGEVITGRDAKGCKGESGKSCYDFTPE